MMTVIHGPEEYKKMLLDWGWSVVEAGLSDGMYVLENPEFPGRQIVFPMDRDAPDYAEAISRSFDKLLEMVGAEKQALLLNCFFC